MTDSSFGKNYENGEEIHATSRVVLDGDLSPAKLVSLIGLGREEEALDYKRSYDLSGKGFAKDKVEITRDVVAMANTSGGYIVLGVDEIRSDATATYQPTGLLPEHLEALDIDKLKPQIESYLNVPVSVQLQRHHLDEYGGRCFALIYVQESSQGPVIMEKQGQYEENGRNVMVFRSGDVLVRVGGSSRRADQNAMREQVSKMRRRERERWTEEILGVRELTDRLDRLIKALGESVSVAGPGRSSGQVGPLSRHDEVNFFLGNSAFEGMTFEALRAEDDLSLRWYLNNASPTFLRAVEEAAHSDNTIEAATIRDDRLEPLLDNLAVLAITCIKYRRTQYLTEIRDALYTIYEVAHTTNFDRLALSVGLRQSWMWEAVVKRVYAIGAVLLRSSLYEEVPLFIRQQIRWDDYWRDQFWSRHALTMRSRDGGLTRQGLCALTEDFVEKREWFYGAFGGNKDDVISTLCQFDFLQCIHAIHNSEDFGAGYPSFGIYDNRRTEPILSRILRDNRVREALLPQIPDGRLAMIIKSLDKGAGREFVAFNGWKADHWQDPKVRSFLGQFPDPIY